jgi:hypothetical protein
VKRAVRFGALLIAVAVAAAGRSHACPFCFGSLQLTLREQIETADATVIIRWNAGEPGDLNREIPASTTFEIVDVLRGEVAAGESLTIDRHQEGKPGDVFLMSGKRTGDALQWDRAVPVSTEGLAYLRDLPAATASITEKLRYALRYLESADDTVATDAFTVLGAARFEDIAALKSELPKSKLRRWVFGGERIKGQLGVYGMLVGLCGDASDRQKLEALILDVGDPDGFRLGIAGVMGGYLLLAQAEGLDVLERRFLARADASAGDQAAVMEALRFIGQYAEDRISKQRLAQSVRRSLDTIDLPELAIADLARWQDWSAVGELLERYGDPQRSDKHVKKAIICFMLAAAQADRSSLSADEQAALDAAAQFLETLQKEDPTLYKRAARSSGTAK